MLVNLFKKLKYFQDLEHVKCELRPDNSNTILTGTATGKRPLGRPRHGWEDNIRIDLKEIGINTRNWADSALDRDYW